MNLEQLKEKIKEKDAHYTPDLLEMVNKIQEYPWDNRGVSFSNKSLKGLTVDKLISIVGLKTYWDRDQIVYALKNLVIEPRKKLTLLQKIKKLWK